MAASSLRPPGPRGGAFSDFHDLMRHRIMDILLVASPYDRFVLEEAGQLSERMLGEFRNLDLHYGPGLTGVATGAEALRLATEQTRFNLVITTLQLADMTAVELAARLREAGRDVPVVALAFDTRELKDTLTRHPVNDVRRFYLWQGDARVLLAIVKDVEDRANAAHDVATVGVQVILLVEDNVRYYSSFLPAIYAELLHQGQRLLEESPNLSDRITRMRARPKILLCGSFEEAWGLFEQYRDDVLGVISDVEFPHQGRRDPEAGLELARRVRGPCPDVPVLLQSSRPENEERAREVGADFLVKGSPRLLHDLRRFMTHYLGFGDFVFQLPDGTEVGRAVDLRRLEEMLHTVPAESIAYHSERNHFSKWLKARTEFSLAHELRPRRLSDYQGVEHLRQGLIRAIADYRRSRGQSVVADFERERFDASFDFYRLGGGSLGGKARGLAFMRRLLAEGRVGHGLPRVKVDVPACVVLGTDVFDRFLEENDLRDFALECDDDLVLQQRFGQASLPEDVRRGLHVLLEKVDYPLAVRSSSLLEDSQYQPFTGVYETYMLPNRHRRLEVRHTQLLTAIQRVYASTFCRAAKSYIRATPYRLEEEKMAVVVQRIAGSLHGPRFYPDFAGVARSHDFYPRPPFTAADGVAAVALGLGRSVVEGGSCLRFCPRGPRHVPSFSSLAEVRRNSQSSFWALDVGDSFLAQDMRETAYDLEAAEQDGTLASLASTWSVENSVLYDGVSRPGPRVVTFAGVLKHERFPLAELVHRLLELGAWAMGGPVEIEFAVTLSPPSGPPDEFAFLQLRPLALSRETEELTIGAVDPAQVVCRSANVLGNGRLELHDVVVVDQARFERARSRETAQELAQVNADLVEARRPYLLIGVGRLGSADPWLGIPVSWDQISGARVIVEAGFRDFRVTPSQGTHFFQNLTSFNIGYFTVNPDAGEGFVDWGWLAAQPVVRETATVRHLRFAQPVRVTMDGKRQQGVVLKPDGEPA